MFEAFLLRHGKGNLRDASRCLMKNEYADTPQSTAMLL
jgi:hypothetical protein